MCAYDGLLRVPSYLVVVESVCSLDRTQITSVTNLRASPVASGRQEKSSDPKKTPKAYEADEEEEEPHTNRTSLGLQADCFLCYMKLYLCFVVQKVNITYVFKVGLVLRAAHPERPS